MGFRNQLTQAQLTAAINALAAKLGTTVGVPSVDPSGNVTANYSTPWGIDATTGVPYFNADGAAAGEEAILTPSQGIAIDATGVYYDPSLIGKLTLVKAGGPDVTVGG